MALHARSSGMRAGEWELGGAVIKGGWHPCRGGVAQLAVLRESRSGVIGIGGALEIFQMA